MMSGATETNRKQRGASPTTSIPMGERLALHPRHQRVRRRKCSASTDLGTFRAPYQQRSSRAASALEPTRIEHASPAMFELPSARTGRHESAQGTTTCAVIWCSVQSVVRVGTSDRAQCSPGDTIPVLQAGVAFFVFLLLLLLLPRLPPSWSTLNTHAKCWDQAAHD